METLLLASFYSAFRDRWLGSEWNDWPELHARALAGEPMISFKQRGRG